MLNPTQSRKWMPQHPAWHHAPAHYRRPRTHFIKGRWRAIRTAWQISYD
jgi:hypothetical protein